MQQSSATPSLHLGFWGLRKIVACSKSSSQCLLVATVLGTVSSLHPTSFFTLIYTYHLLYIHVHDKFKATQHNLLVEVWLPQVGFEPKTLISLDKHSVATEQLRQIPFATYM